MRGHAVTQKARRLRVLPVEPTQDTWPDRIFEILLLGMMGVGVLMLIALGISAYWQSGRLPELLMLVIMVIGTGVVVRDWASRP